MSAVAQTVSVSRGKTAIEHDLREYTPNNVNEGMTLYNVVFINELGGRTLEQYTNEYMKPYIEEYNSKQKRSDRMKSYDYVSDYMQEQLNRAAKQQHYTPGAIAYEYVIQFGDHQSMNVNEVVADEKLYKDVVKMYEEFIQSYQSKYPHMKIVLATLHMDEPKGTPHMHILVQPIGEGYKQGLSHQVSLTKALACDGFERADKRGDRLSLTRWQDDIKNNVMEPILVAHFYERAYRDGEKHHMTVSQYKNAMEEKEKILSEAKNEATEMIEEAVDELCEIEKEKEKIINGTSNSGYVTAPYDEWSIEDLKYERDFIINGDEESDDIKHMPLEELKKKRDTLVKDYNNLVNGYEKDGKHVQSYRELYKNYSFLKEYPARVLETEEGQEALEEAKDEIVEKTTQSFGKKLIRFIQCKIVEQIKRYLLEPIYEAVDAMLYEHGLKINANDKRMLDKAVDKAIDDAVDSLNMGADIEKVVSEHMPDKEQIEEEVAMQVRRRVR